MSGLTIGLSLQVDPYFKTPGDKRSQAHLLTTTIQ